MPVILSDIHFHNWAPFADIVNGVNSRLQQTLDATREAFDYAEQHDKIVLVAGDVFHTRGQLIPSVFNPVKQLWQEYENKGLKFYMIAGNHDCENLNAELNKTSLDSFQNENCQVVTQGYQTFDLQNRTLWAFAWVDDIEILKQEIENCRPKMESNDIVMIHATITGINSHIWEGLDPDWLKGLPCAFVLAGHIHKHQNFDNKVFSIGSLTQQNMGDMDKDCGFLYINEKNKVEHIATSAPKFYDITKKEVDGSYVFAKQVKNNYVRITLENVSEEDKRDIEKTLKSLKPLKLDIRYSKKTTSARKEVVSSSKVSSADITEKYINKQSFEHKEETIKQASKILEKAGETDE